MTEISTSMPKITVDCLETYRRNKKQCTDVTADNAVNPCDTVQSETLQSDAVQKQNAKEMTQEKPKMVDPRFVTVEPFYSIH